MAPRHRRSVWPSIAVVAAAAAFGGVIWYAYQNSHGGAGSGAPPLIKADTGPVKVKPDQPGGQEAPFQDSTVYDRLSPNGQKPQGEKLLPPPEAPVARPQPAPPAPVASNGGSAAPQAGSADPPPLPPAGAVQLSPNDSSPTALAPAPGSIVMTPPRPLAHPVPQVMPQSVLADVPKGKGGAVKPVHAKTPPVPQPTAKAVKPVTIAELEAKSLAKAPPPQMAAALPKPGAKPTPAAPAKPATLQMPPIASKPAAPVATATVKSGGGTGGWRVQLSSVRSEGAVGVEWAKLKQRAPELGSLKLMPSKADIPGKGTFYRLQAGPLDEAAAKSMCNHLRSQGLGCLVVRP